MPRTEIEFPVLVGSQVVDYVPNVVVDLATAGDGDLYSITLVQDRLAYGAPVVIYETTRDVNGKAIWQAVCAKLDTDPHLRAALEAEAYDADGYDTSPEAQRRELGHSMRELV